MTRFGTVLHIAMLTGRIPYENFVPNYHIRHALRRSMTVLTQVRDLCVPICNDAIAERRIAADFKYIRTFMSWGDLKLLGGKGVQ